MTKLEFKKLLTELGACEEATIWAKGKTLKTVWETCDRGDWLLWLVRNMSDKPKWSTKKQVVLAACICAETALKYVPKGELRPKQCIDITRRWASGDPTVSLDDVRKAAAYAADAANAAYAAAYAAARAAARAAADAARAADAAARAAADAAYAAAYAAYAADAAYAAARAAADAARAASLKECADIVRKVLTPVMEILK